MECMWCEETMTDYTPPAGCQLDPMGHTECILSSQLGGIGHLADHDHWCVRHRRCDQGLGFRESAVRVWAWVAEHGVELALERAANRPSRDTIRLARIAAGRPVQDVLPGVGRAS